MLSKIKSWKIYIILSAIIITLWEVLKQKNKKIDDLKLKNKVKDKINTIQQKQAESIKEALTSEQAEIEQAVKNNRTGSNADRLNRM